MNAIINFLVYDNISSFIIRGAAIIIIAVYFGGKILKFQKSNLLKIKTSKYDYVRKMYYDYEKNKRSFFFSIQ